MGTSKCPAAHPGVQLPCPLVHSVDVSGALAVPELTHVEVAFSSVDPEGLAPAEEAVAGGLHQPLATAHTAPAMAEGALAGVGLEHRGLRLLRLEEEWVAVVAAGEQDDPRPGPDASHADHLVGQVTEAVGLQQLPPVALERLGIALDDLAHRRFRIRPLLPRAQLAGRADQAGAADYPKLAVNRPGEAIERPQAVLGTRLGQALLGFPHRLAVLLRAQNTHHQLDV